MNSKPTPEEQRAIDQYREILDPLRLPFGNDLSATGGDYPNDRQWTLPALDDRAEQDLPAEPRAPSTAPAQQSPSQSQSSQSYAKPASKTSSPGDSGKE